KLAEERQVDVEFFVALAVERAHRRLRYAAGRAHLLVVEHERGRPISGIGLLEYATPHLLGAAEHLGNESSRLIGRYPGRRRACFGLRAYLFDGVDDCSSVESKEIGDQGNDHTPDTQSARCHSHAATVLDIGTTLLVA